MIKVNYGVKSIMIGKTNVDHEKYDRFISRPIVTNRMGGIQFSGSFRIHESELTPKKLRILFGNNWNKMPKQVVCRFKLKSKKFAHPVYQIFVFPKYAVDTPEKLRSITKFVRACYLQF